MSDAFIDSRGGCVPVLKDVDEIVVDKCKPTECGDKTIGVPIYTMVVTNPGDDVLRNEDGTPILIDGQVVQKPVA